MPTADPARASGRTYWPALDGLRGLAIIVVVLHNTTGIEVRDTLPEKLWTFVVDAGWVGVQLFFVLSGFLITGILLRSRGKARALRSFYARRALRIFPLYYLFLAGRFVLIPLFVPSTAVPFGEELPFWLYLSNWGDLLATTPLAAMGHFWSLAVEEQFYLVWPALAMVLQVRTFAWVCVGIAIAALASRVGMRVAGVPDKWMYAATFARADALSLGALAAIALRNEKTRELYRRVRMPSLVVAGLGLVAVMAYAHGLSRFEWLVQSVGYSLLAVLFAVLVTESATEVPRGWRRWLAHPALRLVGKYSYAIYIIHVPVKYVLVNEVFDQPMFLDTAHSIVADMAFIGLVAAISFALAALSFVAIERPILRLKNRVSAG
ncbi:MAG: acyltransferase [Dokdonella sp.]